MHQGAHGLAEVRSFDSIDNAPEERERGIHRIDVIIFLQAARFLQPYLPLVGTYGSFPLSSYLSYCN